MNQAHFDALTSFVFNCGVGTLSSDYGFRRALLNAVDVSGFSGSATGTVNVDDVGPGRRPCVQQRLPHQPASHHLGHWRYRHRDQRLLHPYQHQAGGVGTR